MKKLDIKKIAQEINSGKAIVLPFDTVYGLVANPFNTDAMNKIYNIKGRDFNKPIALIFSSVDMVKQYINLDKKVETFIKAKTPGAYTFIFPWSKKERSHFANQYHSLEKVGIRIPDNKNILDLIKKLGQPIAATSANVSDQPNCWSVQEFESQIKDNEYQPDLIIDGGVLSKNPPSEVVDISNIEEIKILRN
ncbi:MAG: L-threonylcarbamoyladenylate synthase [Patescibacteria group bacterium]